MMDPWIKMVPYFQTFSPSSPRFQCPFSGNNQYELARKWGSKPLEEPQNSAKSYDFWVPQNHPSYWNIKYYWNPRAKWVPRVSGLYKTCHVFSCEQTPSPVGCEFKAATVSFSVEKFPCKLFDWIGIVLSKTHQACNFWPTSQWL